MSSYVTVDEMSQLAIAPARLSNVPWELQQKILDSVSSLADSHLASRFPVPVTPGDDLKQAIAHIAAFRLLLRRGFNPADDSAQAMKELHDSSMQWLKDVAEGDATPAGLHAGGGSASEASRQYVWNASLDETTGLTVVDTPTPRGW